MFSVGPLWTGNVQQVYDDHHATGITSLQAENRQLFVHLPEVSAPSARYVMFAQVARFVFIAVHITSDHCRMKDDKTNVFFCII